MCKDLHSMHSRSIAILLSVGLFLSAFQYYERWEDLPVDGDHPIQQVGEDHIFCPACSAIFTCCTESSPRTVPHEQSQPGPVSLADAPAASPLLAGNGTRAPPQR